MNPLNLGDVTIDRIVELEGLGYEPTFFFPDATMEGFKEQMDCLIRQIRDAPKAKGAERIYLPGEMEWDKYDKAMREGIELPEDVVASLTGLAEDYDMDIKNLCR